MKQWFNFITKNNKLNLPRVMLIPNIVSWILGTWSREIVKWNSLHYDFIIFPFEEIFENNKLFSDLLNEVDIVHCLSQSIYTKVVAEIHKLNVPDIILISSIHHIVRFSQIEACLAADKVMVVCHQVLEELVSHNVPEEKIVLIYNGVDTNFFKPEDKVIAKQQFSVSGDTFTIGFSASAASDHDGRKGIDTFKSLLMQVAQSEMKIDVIMTGPGWYEFLKSPELQSVSIHYHPYLSADRMPSFYNALDAFVVTARVEGGPVPPLEAMSCNTAIISTPVGTILDFIQDGKNGLIVPIGDANATFAAVRKIYSDRSLAQDLGVAGRETILNHLQWKDTLSRMDRLYGYQIKMIRSRNKIRGDYTKLNADLIHRDELRWQEKYRLGAT